MNKMVRQMLPFATLALIICILSALKPDSFLTTENILNVLSRSSVNGIMAVGMTAVIISCGIDLSVGSMLALSGMAGAYTILLTGGVDSGPTAMLIGTGVGILCGTVCGFLNGTLITKLKLPPFIVTLGLLEILRGLSYHVTDGLPIENVPRGCWPDPPPPFVRRPAACRR